ncbi:MAG: transcriptional regulator [Thermoplasmatota archaeon]
MPPGPPDPVLHQPVRLQIMTYLYKSRQAGFTELRKELDLTPGNLQRHGERLQKAGYIQMSRVLAGFFEVRWHITPHGQAAFEQYVRDLRALIESLEEAADEPGGGAEK